MCACTMPRAQNKDGRRFKSIVKTKYIDDLGKVYLCIRERTEDMGSEIVFRDFEQPPPLFLM